MMQSPKVSFVLVNLVLLSLALFLGGCKKVKMRTVPIEVRPTVTKIHLHLKIKVDFKELKPKDVSVHVDGPMKTKQAKLDPSGVATITYPLSAFYRGGLKNLGVSINGNMRKGYTTWFFRGKKDFTVQIPQKDAIFAIKGCALPKERFLLSIKLKTNKRADNCFPDKDGLLHIQLVGPIGSTIKGFGKTLILAGSKQKIFKLPFVGWLKHLKIASTTKPLSTKSFLSKITPVPEWTVSLEFTHKKKTKTVKLQFSKEKKGPSPKYVLPALKKFGLLAQKGSKHGLYQTLGYWSHWGAVKDATFGQIRYIAVARHSKAKKLRTCRYRTRSGKRIKAPLMGTSIRVEVLDLLSKKKKSRSFRPSRRCPRSTFVRKRGRKEVFAFPEKKTIRRWLSRKFR